MNAKEQEKLALIEQRINSREIINQKSWKFIKELNSYSEESLNRVALINGKRKFTYRQLFRQWDRYAEVFFAMKITQKQNSRVAMIPNVSAECISVFYALNMNGVSVSMLPVEETHNGKQFLDTLRNEEITDVIIAESCAWPGLLRTLYFHRRDLELGHIIILPSYVDGPYAMPLERLQARTYEKILKLFPDFERMDDLIKKYEATPLTLGTIESDAAAVITHTSGTTKGIHKPIPLSDRGLNAAAVNIIEYEPFKKFINTGVTAVTKEMTAAYGMVDMVHVPLALGCTNVIVPMGAFNPLFYKAIAEHKVNLLLTGADQFKDWMDRRACRKYDFSSLEFVALGGYYLSPDIIGKINAFIADHGGTVKAVSGYGLSEAGGACILPDPDLAQDDVIGRPLPGVDIRIYDEKDHKYYGLEDGPRTGGLYISSDVISLGQIGDRVFFEPVEIDGKPFISTCDLVKLREDKNLSYAGRTNRFFANNEGVRFNAGIIETALSGQPGIEGCAVVPKYRKDIYDTIPVLYVQTCGLGCNAMESVKSGLLEIFNGEDNFDLAQLPVSLVLTDRIPRNDTGKVDLHRITRGLCKGAPYKIKGICKDGKLVDVRFLPEEEKPESPMQAFGLGCDQEEDEEETAGMGCDQEMAGMGCDQ